MNDKERQARGAAVRRKILGNAWVDKSEKSRTDFNEEWYDYLHRGVWSEIWTRPQLDERTRRVLVLGTMIALAKWDEFRLHVRAALTEGGFTPDDIKEVILQQSAYCGVPAGNNAFREAGLVLQELGK
jgi:alkylhydroperoxidase/carboxymuconolactone decarboxylase family protein YurZ